MLDQTVIVLSRRSRHWCQEALCCFLCSMSSTSVIDHINRNVAPKPGFSSFFILPQLSISFQRWSVERGCRCKRALSQCARGHLNGPVLSCSALGLLWSWGALIHSQITSNCLAFFFWACLLTGAFTSTAENIKARQVTPPPVKTHIFATYLPGSSVDSSLLAMPARWHLQISAGQKRKKRVFLSLSYGLSYNTWDHGNYRLVKLTAQRFPALSAVYSHRLPFNHWLFNLINHSGGKIITVSSLPGVGVGGPQCSWGGHCRQAFAVLNKHRAVMLHA